MANLFKEIRSSIQADDRSDSTPEMLDSVNALILADRKDIIEDISEQHGISIGRAQKLCIMTSLFLKPNDVGFHQENARPHTTVRTVEAISQ